MLGQFRLSMRKEVLINDCQNPFRKKGHMTSELLDIVSMAHNAQHTIQTSECLLTLTKKNEKKINTEVF